GVRRTARYDFLRLRALALAIDVEELAGQAIVDQNSCVMPEIGEWTTIAIQRFAPEQLRPLDLGGVIDRALRRVQTANDVGVHDADGASWRWRPSPAPRV